MLKVKALLSKILNWSGFGYDWSEWETNNTTDTWVPVLRGKKIQHRVIPQGQEFISSKFVNWGNSCSKDDFGTGLVIVSNYLYVVWFAGTAQVGVVGILAGGVQRVEGTGSATLNNITFTRNNYKLTVTSSKSETIRIMG